MKTKTKQMTTRHLPQSGAVKHRPRNRRPKRTRKKTARRRRRKKTMNLPRLESPSLNSCLLINGILKLVWSGWWVSEKLDGV